MLTGVIYGAIVVAWAAYLVPLALRRHDEASRSRSIERFSSAMRILARRGTAPAGATATSAKPDERMVVTPKRQASRVIPPDSAAKVERTLVTPTRNRMAERAAAARRRQVLSLLVMVTFFFGLAALIGIVPRLLLVVPVLLIAGFLVIARLSVRKAHKPYWVSTPVEPEEQETGVVVRRSPVRVSSTRSSDGDSSSSEGRSDDEPTIALTAEQRAQAAARSSRPAAPVPTRSTEGGSLWDPLPVTLPAYAAARPAPRTVRTVSLGQAASAASAAEALAADSTFVEPVEVDEEPAEVRKVVNG